MKKTVALVLVILLFSGWGWLKKEEAAIKIDGIEITAKEFQQAFQTSQFARKGAPGRKEFLDLFVQRKLILKEAEQSGLDRDPGFLRDIQLFWEQSLLKLILAKKTNEAAVNIRVNDEEISDYYEKNKERDFSDKQLPEVYGQIKFLLFRKKQAALIQDWINSLKKKAKLDIDYKLLGIEQK